MKIPASLERAVETYLGGRGLGLRTRASLHYCNRPEDKEHWWKSCPDTLKTTGYQIPGVAVHLRQQSAHWFLLPREGDPFIRLAIALQSRNAECFAMMSQHHYGRGPRDP